MYGMSFLEKVHDPGVLNCHAKLVWKKKRSALKYNEQHKHPFQPFQSCSLLDQGVITLHIMTMN